MERTQPPGGVKSASRTPDSGHTMNNNTNDTSEPQSTTIAFGRLGLTYRMPAPEDASVIKGYVATLVRDDQWSVVTIATERIRRRR